jgi:putative mRNA 3-end processing factor
MGLLQFTDKGIYCAQADVYLDPWRKVHKALITHAHSDHARWGNDAYLAHEFSASIMRHRLGKDIRLETIRYNEPVQINGVKFTFFPAGHIIGSSQILVEYRGERWVFTGDFKTENDGLSTPFEPVKCHTLIMESTFGLPVYQWQPQQAIFQEINAWWRNNANKGNCSVILGYSLGKAQRILKNVDHSIGPVYVHGAVDAIHQALRADGHLLPATIKADLKDDKKLYRNALVIAPPSAAGSPWLRKFEPYSLAVASGWMALRGARRRNAADRGFILSDHADWQGLNDAVQWSGAERVIVTHGYSAVFARWLREKGLQAEEAKTEYAAETPEIDTNVNEKEITHD